MKLFLTDYASYNNGTQFEFGHWVDLTDFNSAEDFLEYCTEHLQEADEKSPIDTFTIREEIMFTDFEGFPQELYCESPDTALLEKIYTGIENDLFDKELEELPYHTFLSETDAEPIMENDEDFFNTYFEGNPGGAVRAAIYGDYNYSHTYVTFNGYGNLETFNSIDQHLDKDEVLTWLLDNPDMI